MKTKAFLLDLAIMVILSVVVSCGGDGDSGSSDNPNEETIFTPSSESTTYFANGIDFPVEDGEVKIRFYTNKPWRASSTETWCNVSPQSGNAGNCAITLKVAANDQLSNRNGVITLSIGGQNNYISISQAGQKFVTYKNVKAGTLPEMLGENSMGIEELTISGELNGTDIELIRRMATYGGSLKSLDIGNARIVKGGISYTSRTVDSSMGDCYTENDIIGKCMFFCMDNIENLILPRNAVILDSYAIWNCSNLKTCILPAALEEIEDQGITYCGELGELVLPESIYHIGDGNFTSMYKLTSITFPSHLQTIGYMTLVNCKNLKEIHIKAAIPPTANGYLKPFERMDIPLYVPAGSLKLYKASSVWATFSNIMEE